MSDCTWNAQDYARHSAQQKKWARELIGKLRLEGHEHVLDIGCGDGLITAEIARKVPQGRVIGIDSSTDMITHARRQFSQKAYPNLSFIEMDARALTFEDAFHVVFSNAVLHWVRDHRPVVQGIARALKPGGRLLLQMGGKGNAAGIIAAHDEVRTRSRWRQWFANFAFPYGFLGVAEYRELLQQAGLVPERVELVPKDMQHEGREGLKGWVRTTWMPYHICVPEEEREAFIDEVIDAYLARHPLDTNGIAHVAMVRIEVAARKPG